MKLSVLISSYDGMSDLPGLLQTLKENLKAVDEKVEVLVRDDNSTDGSADYLATIPWLQLIRGKENVGFVQSNNILFDRSQGEIICCLNQDIILAPDFFREAMSLLEERSDVAGLNTNMIMPWVMGIDEFLQKNTEDFPAWEYQLTPYGFAQYGEVEPRIKETNFITGGAFFLRRSALGNDEDLFDPAIHMYCEDTDLSLRLVNRGEKIIFAPKVAVFHNQVSKKMATFSAAKKLFKITWTRFHVLARNTSLRKFLGQYHLYLYGIVKKMDSLGFSEKKNLRARIVGLLIVPFLLLCLPFFCSKIK